MCTIKNGISSSGADSIILCDNSQARYKNKLLFSIVDDFLALSYGSLTLSYIFIDNNKHILAFLNKITYIKD